MSENKFWAVIRSKSKKINTILSGPHVPETPASMYGPTSNQEYNEWVEVLIIPKFEYDQLKTAFKKAKAYIDLSPCDPDIYPDQMKAWGEYQEALKELGEV